jgi:hypothetical protein
MRSRKIPTPQSAPVGFREFSPHRRGQRIGQARVHWCRISLARVGRTLLSDAFDLDLDSDFAQRARIRKHPGRADASAPRKARKSGTRLQPLRHAQARCHPERSMRIRLTNPHAQSQSLPRAKPRGPLTLPHVPQPSQGVLPVLSEQRIGKGTSTGAASALLVWVGHSCPTPLMLILTLILRSAHGPCNTVEKRTLQRRVKLSSRTEHADSPYESACAVEGPLRCRTCLSHLREFSPYRRSRGSGRARVHSCHQRPIRNTVILSGASR